MGGFEGRSVAVTGAAGSIGMQLCRDVLRQGAERLVLISLTEGGLYDATRRLRAEFPQAELVPVLGSFGNPVLVARALKDVEVLVHAGAHKHVPICEANPIEAIANNVLGSATLLDTARWICDRVVVVSTDKAVNPSGVMGRTKRVVERLALQYSSDRCAISVVRFGNVLDSAGSVMPLWREQIAAGGPLTLTDEACERYFMTIPQAVRLIAHTVEFGIGGKVYVLRMGERKRMGDLARQLIAESGKRIEVRITGLRAGEKLIEELSHDEEMIDVADGIAMVTSRAIPVHALDLGRLAYACSIDDAPLALRLLERLAT